MIKTFNEPWPKLPYEAFKSTGYLLHMAVQAIGKLKLLTPFQPHWSNVVLFVTSRGLTTGPIPYEKKGFTVDVDLIDHQIICTSSSAHIGKFDITSMSVAQFTEKLFSVLRSMAIDIIINPMPQEIPNPIPFNQDKERRQYNSQLANDWWRILLSTERVLQRYHARFDGETPPIGLMWGTFDIRDARYNGIDVPTTGANSGYLRRNAMNQAQVEAGWWSGNPAYQKAAFYSFTYPQPDGIENASIQPKVARWEKSLGEFLLDYDDLRLSKTPEQDLLDFFESAYDVGAKLAGWDPKLIVSGKPT